MSRIYAAAQDNWRWFDAPRADTRTTTIVEVEPRPPRFSGLYDASGNKLMVIETREPIGFVRLQER